jgi:cytochrome c5
MGHFTFSMKITYTTKNNRFQLEVEANSPKDAFKKVAEFQEVFEGETCGACQSDDVRFQVRGVEGNDYYELKCNACFAKLAFGQHKVGGTLFPKRKLADGSYDKENKGWHKWTTQS